MAENHGVFGLGQCSLDYIGRVPSYPPADVKCEFTNLVVEGGGPAATALVALSRWGVECAFAGLVGDDSFGELIVASLQREGINTGGVVTRRGCASQFAFIAAEEGTGRRTIFWRRPTGEELRSSEIDFDALRRRSLFLTDGIYPEASLAGAAEARRSGLPVIVDAGSLREGMVELAAESDFFIASETFARSYGGDASVEEVCRSLGELGPTVTGVTLGARGYAALFDGRYLVRPAYPVEAADTTGCGDVFHGGFAFGILQGWNPERSLDFAAWAAAMVSRRLGGRAGIPPPEEYPAPGR